MALLSVSESAQVKGCWFQSGGLQYLRVVLAS